MTVSAQIAGMVGSAARAASAADTAAALRKLLVGELRRHRPGSLRIDRAADGLGLSVRTLQRRLAEVGQSFTRLRDRVRLEEACRLLDSPDARLIDVEYHLGYSDPGHFTRAFRGWTGIAPRSFRQRIGANPEGGRTSKSSAVLWRG